MVQPKLMWFGFRSIGNSVWTKLPQQVTWFKKQHGLEHAHFKVLHNGVKQILTHIRERFWICRGRSYVKGILSKCVICKTLMGKPSDYPESPPLPSSRLRDDFAFSSTGLDRANLFQKYLS